MTRSSPDIEEALRNLLQRVDDHFGGYTGQEWDWKEQADARAALSRHDTQPPAVNDEAATPISPEAVQAILEDEVYCDRFDGTYDYGDAVSRIVALHTPAQGAEGIRWARVNDEPFEYAIQQGPHGDEFVKLINGLCLRRSIDPAQGSVDRDMLAALQAVNKLISEAALTGFNCHDGDWAERLFHSQQATSTAIKKAVAMTSTEGK
jgi:hypothetical protein